MLIKNRCLELEQFFPGGKFHIDNWLRYMDHVLPGAADMCLAEIQDYDFTAQCLPIIQDALSNSEKQDQVIRSFRKVTQHLDQRIRQVFNRSLDTELVLYLGLCNGAGWVTEVGGKCMVLLGIEKIIELDWGSEQDMYGLLYHELGHVYQSQYGILERKCSTSSDSFLWQLYTEGVAMCFEQLLMGSSDYYHQDQNGWKAYLDAHFTELKADFSRDLATMTQKNQKYFGDWARWQGHGDAGYYLGARFVQFLLEKWAFNEILSLEFPRLHTLFQEFLNT